MDLNEINKAFSSGKKKSYLSPKMEELINSLILAEFNASQLYKAMKVWCEHAGYEGMAKYIKSQVLEERAHMNKLYEYSADRQCIPTTPAVKSHPSKFKDLKDVVEKALEHEELIEDTYKKAVSLAWADKDYTTFSFLQWFLTEQVEEIKMFSGFLDRMEVAGCDKRGQYLFDAELLERLKG